MCCQLLVKAALCCSNYLTSIGILLCMMQVIGFLDNLYLLIIIVFHSWLYILFGIQIYIRSRPVHLSIYFVFRWAMFQAKVWGRTCRVFLHQLRLFCVKAVVLLDCMDQRNLKGQNRIFRHYLTLMKKKKSFLCKSCSSGRKEMCVFISLFL